MWLKYLNRRVTSPGLASGFDIFDAQTFVRQTISIHQPIFKYTDFDHAQAMSDLLIGLAVYPILFQTRNPCGRDSRDRLC